MVKSPLKSSTNEGFWQPLNGKILDRPRFQLTSEDIGGAGEEGVMAVLVKPQAIP